MKFNALLLIPLAAMMLGGCNQENPYFDDREGKIEDYNGYYQFSGTYLDADDNEKPLSVSINYEDRGQALAIKLHNLMIATHTTYAKYGEFKETATYKKSSYNPKTKKIVYFYTGKEVSSYNATREHVWPCANSGGLWQRDSEAGTDIGEDYQGGGSDLYHVMPCSSNVNTMRGNSKYTEFGEGVKFYKGTDGGKYQLKGDAYSFSNKSEPAKEYRGDIARIICYLYVHYNGIGVTNKYCGKTDALTFNNVVIACAGEAVKETIARWNYEDPVDDVELYRNEQVSKYQGNRNPFIDHPEFVWKMLGVE